MSGLGPRNGGQGLRIALLLCAVLLLFGCARPQVFQQEAYVFGTRVDLLVAGQDAEQAHQAMGVVLREFDRMHHAYHAWKPSELTALNTAIAAGEAHQVSAELAEILRNAQQLASLGEQLFDPALGALIALWGFHDDEFIPVMPDPAEIERILAAAPHIADLEIDGSLVRSRNPAVQLDLGGYAKGLALDRAATLLREQGIENALINIGGNVLALGDKHGTPWRIGIQHPREPRPLATLPLYDGEAIGTSGDYQRFFDLDGERYSHLLDPRTGRPAHGSQSLTVLVTPREHAGTLSDAASKPAFIDAARWREHLAAYGIDHGLLVDAEGRVEVTRALRARLKLEGDSRISAVLD